MAVNKPPNPELVKPQFDLSVKDPLPEFLLRPLTAYEISLVKNWVHYYRERSARSPIFPKHAIAGFFARMVPKNYGPNSLEGRNIGDERLHFQVLFTHAPAISVSSALYRITNCNFLLRESERKVAFTNVVELHQEKHGKDALPSWNDFVKYHNDGLYLPRLGFRAVSYAALVYGEHEFDSNNITNFYRKYYRVPEEITEEQLAQFSERRPITDQEAIENYMKVIEDYRSRNPDRDPAISPTEIDVETYAKENGGIPWGRYAFWIASSDGARSFDWLREQCGFSGKRPKVLTGTRLPNGFWTPKRLRERYELAWKAINPDGYRPEEGILRDPPSPKALNALVAKQRDVKIKNNKKLDPKICAELGIPDVDIPRGFQLGKYPGGMCRLLRDIEKEKCPEKGIEFTNKNQIGQLFSSYRNSDLQRSEVPLAVASYRPVRRSLSR